MVKRRKGLGDFLQNEGRQALESLPSGPVETEPQTPKNTEFENYKDTDLQSLLGTNPVSLIEIDTQALKDTESKNYRDTDLQNPSDTNSVSLVETYPQSLVETDLQSFSHVLGVKQGVGPLFARLTRKEVRLRDDQYQQLTVLARKLQKVKAQTRERITENTLIRVAIDLLLERQQALKGESEVDLYRSVQKAQLD